MTKLIQLLIIGIATGSIYGLIALGFTLVYKATRVFNFAQGDVMMLGAYMAVTFTVTLNWGWWAIPAAIASAIPIGWAFQFVFARPMIGQPFLPVVMATIGAALVLQSIVPYVWGVIERPYPSKFPQGIENIGGVFVSYIDLITIAVASGCVLAFVVFFRFTSIGLQMRASASNNEAAILSGVNVHRVSLLAWGIGSLLAFVGGLILANQQGNVTLSYTALGLLAFPAVVIGGLESVQGAVVGGLIVGVLEAMIAGYYDPLAATSLVYAALLIILLVRPTGLFGQREIQRV